MEVRGDVLLVIIGAALVTLIPRVVPLMVLSRMRIPDWVMRWLNYIPIAVMAALVGEQLMTAEGGLFQNKIELLAALPTFAMAILTRSLLGTVAVGIVSVMVLRLLL
ncbi:AzlD domain-containing protein [Paenibacillus radicis (ex Gao et al. 2016)]|uniref:Branched-chain amino acid ABC transporter n=1 Tax=Paenibacillus radicis (ex Gao et al. 2016) TaxID=1737354 RepID=A0A917LVJ0_9BACL|nr:AzlD domain-containing protein [Paenibacillus radicis (ex Gao et al. 2016)]GGG61033.1 branched-chain amino acid ABC transporter [Paenibacillus radicis (ex Gao et al. 2016)]